MKTRAVFILLLVLAVFAVYAPSLWNGFVWDDTALVARDPFIRSWRLIPEGFRHFLFTDATASDFYRPLQRLSYTWDYAWFAFHPWGYHLTSIALHAAAAVMLFLFLEKLARGWPGAEPRGGGDRDNAARDRRLAGLAALAWAVHPLHTSAVCYVSGRADVLAALFAFAGLWLALRGTRAADAGAALCFFGAALSKESGLMALAIWLALLLFRRAKILRPLALCIGVAAIYCALRFSAQHEPAPRFTPPPSLAARPIIAARAWAEYAGLVLLPVHLHMERDVLPFGHGGDLATTVRLAQWREVQTLLGAVLIAAFVFWMRWARRRGPLVLALLTAFLLAYLPISNLLPLNATVAEHWLYFPGAFLLAAALWSLARIPLARAAGAALLALWLLFLAARTFQRNFDWRDPRTFLERTIAEGGGSARMLINLGSLESAEGRQKIAIGHFTNALALAPGQPFALLGLGAAYLREKDFARARAEFEKAARDPFARADALQSLAVLEYQESGADRVDLLRDAAQLAPRNWAIQKRCIAHLAERGGGDRVRAIAQLRELVQREPWRADSWRMLGDLWMNAGQYDSAHRAYSRAAQLDVHDEYSRAQLRTLKPRS